MNFLKWLNGLSEEPKEKKVQAVEKSKDPTTYLSYENEDFEVGLTYVEIVFKDGQKLEKLIYGEVHQVNYPGHSVGQFLRWYPYEIAKEPCEASAGKPMIKDSLKCAQEFLMYLHPGPGTYVDDQTAPSKTVVGEAISGRILNTYEFSRSAQIAILRDKLIP